MKILIVDDAKANRLLLKAIATQDGHAVCEAEDGLEAISMFRKEAPDMIFMDVMMPKMDGFAAAKEIKKIAKKWVPILFITALSKDDAEMEDIAAGDDYILKPINQKMVSARIASIEKAISFQKKAEEEHERAETALNLLSEETEMAARVSENMMRSNSIWTKRGLAKYAVKPSGAFSGDAIWVEQTPCGALRGFLADAAGHGMASCLNVMPLAPIFTAMTKKGFPLAKIASEMTRTVKRLFPLERFVAGTLVSVDEKRGLLEVWQGGNPLVLHLDENGKVKNRFESKNAPFGIDEDGWEVIVEGGEWNKGDQLLAFSDGFTEHYGSFGDAFRNIVKMASEESREGLFERLKTEMSKETLADDASILWIGGSETNNASEEVIEKSEEKDFLFSFTMRAPQLRTGNPEKKALAVMETMGAERAVANNKFQVVFHEMFSNALEHGLLGVSSSIKEEARGFERYGNLVEKKRAVMQEGWIKIAITSCDGWRSVRLTIEDSGPGFEKEADITDLSGVMSSGRGLTCLSGLCKNWLHKDGSSTVEAEIPLD